MKACCCMSTIIEKQQTEFLTTKHRQLSLIGCATATSCANCDIMFKILHKIRPFGPMSSPETSDVMVIFLLAFFLWPRNYYNDNNITLRTSQHRIVFTAS